MRKWYRIQAKSEDSAEISIFGDIGGWWGGVEVSQFKSDWDEIKDRKDIRVLINSPGGDVFDGIAIYNIIASRREYVSVEVIGLAASAASIIALAGSRLTIDDGAFFMIHNAWGLAIGTADDMREMAATLDKISGELVNIYVARSGLTEDEVRVAMDEETWFTAEEAVIAGFADEAVDNGEVAARAYDLTKYKYAHIPGEMLGSTDSHAMPDNIRDFEAFLREVGYPKSEARRIASHGFDRRDADGVRKDPELEKSARCKAVAAIITIDEELNR